MKSFCFILTFCLFTACAQEKTPPANNQVLQNLANAGSANAAHVTFQNSGLYLSYAWEKLPTETESGSFIFKTYRPNLADQSPVQMALPKVPEVILWMPSMGHGSSPTTVTELDTGTYRVSDVYFIMPGNWEIKFQLKTSETVDDEAVVPFTY